MNPNEFINVHTLDGKLRGKYEPQNKLTIPEKREKFNELLSHITDPFAILTVNIIINDLIVENSQNYDHINQIDTSDLLGDICSKDIKDFKDFLEEQLTDVCKLGLCPQGRTVRLFQIWESIKDQD